MSTVETIRGPVELDALGTTLMHEHVFVMQPEALQNYGSAWGEPDWDEDARSDDAIAGLFVRELTEGINDTGVRAAFLKCAVERHGLIGDVPRILRVIAAAAVQTGAPVMVHNPPFADERPDYLFISHEILPRLREAGVTRGVIEQMMVGNPRAFFSPGS